MFAADDKAESRALASAESDECVKGGGEIGVSRLAKAAGSQTETETNRQRRPQGKSTSSVEGRRQKLSKSPRKTASLSSVKRNTAQPQQQQRCVFDVDTTSSHKLYTPDVFTGEHVSELLAQNAALQNRLESVELERHQQHVHMQKLAAEAEARERCLREEMEETIAAVTAAHQRQLQQVIATHAVEQSTSRTAELHSRVCTQDVMIAHLKQQLADSRVDAERMASLAVTKLALEEQVKKLGEELCEAKSASTPLMRHFDALHDKIVKMETRHRMREQQLEQLQQQQSEMTTDHDEAEQQDTLTRHWRTLVDDKNRQIDRFRAELDAILEVLRQLQSQGVVIPYCFSANGPTVNSSQTDDDPPTGRT